jgi:hypothetical protein
VSRTREEIAADVAEAEELVADARANVNAQTAQMAAVWDDVAAMSLVPSR